MDKYDAKREQNGESSDSGSGGDEQVLRRARRPGRTPATASGAASSGLTTASVPGRRRRYGAFARERNLRHLDERALLPLRSMNRAYEGLLRVIPHDKNRTLSEEEIVTLAKNYIKTLTNVISSYSGDTFQFNDNDQL